MGWDEEDGDPMVLYALYISACAHMVYPYAPLDGRAYRYMYIMYVHPISWHLEVLRPLNMGPKGSKYGVLRSEDLQIWRPSGSRTPQIWGPPQIQGVPPDWTPSRWCPDGVHMGSCQPPPGRWAIVGIYGPLGVWTPQEGPWRVPKGSQKGSKRGQNTPF